MAVKTLLAFCVAATAGLAQDLTPRAYVITPVGANAVVLSYSYLDGSVFTDPTVPIQNFTVRYDAEVLSYFHAFDLGGRSANITGSIPYAVGDFRATVAGVDAHVYRSGLADGRVRVAVNLKGGPALSLDDFREWREKMVLGFSMTVVTPSGQYDPARLVNPSVHRWAFKPELGLSHRWSNRWALDFYAGSWFFTPNDQYFPGIYTRSQKPIGAGELHLSYYATPRLWVSLDGNYWMGGRTTIEGIANADYQRNSRVGVTLSVPMNAHQALKASYSRGAYISIGGDYTSLSAGWQYSWIGRPR